MLELVDSIEKADYITHSGIFHADDIFATAFFLLLKEKIKLYRTTDINPKEYPNKIIYDVGRGELDHHQVDGKKRENGIPYCSFGLIFKKYGEELLKKKQVKYRKEVWEEIDTDLVEQIDAIDNGVFPKVDAKYKVKNLCDIIKLMNPSFRSGEIAEKQFIKAVEIAKIILEEEIVSAAGRIIAKHIIEKEFKNAKNHMLILKEYMPYEEAVLKKDEKEEILFVIYPSTRGGYAIKTVPKSLTDRSDRMKFPEKWAGKQNKELEEISGIKGIGFCHNSLFLTTCDSIETAKKIVKKVIEIRKESVNQ